jgi:hypothetical protein
MLELVNHRSNKDECLLYHFDLDAVEHCDCDTFGGFGISMGITAGTGSNFQYAGYMQPKAESELQREQNYISARAKMVFSY